MQKLLTIRNVMQHSLLKKLLTLYKTGLLAGLVVILAGLISPANATSFYKNFVIINGMYYYTNGSTASTKPNFQGANFTNAGNPYDQSTGSLILGAEANTVGTNGDNVQSTQLFYRVYKQGATAGDFIPLNLPFLRAGLDGNPDNKRWSNTSAKVNLIRAANAGSGTYILEVSYQLTASYNNSGGSGTFVINDVNYSATFQVASSTPTTTWSGATDNNWFNAGNWNKGVPNESTDATIPQGSPTYPFIDNSPGAASLAVARVRNLRIQGTSLSNQAKVFLQGGTLEVYGNFEDPTGGFTQTNSSTFSLAGVNQTFDGGKFFRFRVTGGGTKTLTTSMTVATELAFYSTGGILATALDNVTTHNVTLLRGAKVLGETDNSYVFGVLTANQDIAQGQAGSFGGIGIELTANDASVGTTTVTRVTNVYKGAGQSVSIRRGFIFAAQNASATNDFTLAFHYLTPDLGAIDPNNLVLFRSLNGNAPFQPLGKTANDPGNHTLTKLNITGSLSATFTLGDNTNPLPVTLTRFTAVAQGADAVLTWATAQEVNSQGFEVQVSTDGMAFSKLGFVASAAPNSSEAHTYQYRDATPGKQGTRYYRLRQLDLDGKESFFGPQAVAFGASALAASVQGYPNPFGADFTLALQTAAAGPATVSVFDGVGRQVRLVQPTLAAGSSSLVLGDLASLPHGLYVVQVRYADGQTQRLKVVKE